MYDYYGEDWPEIRNQVLIRFQFKCSGCGRTKAQINLAGEQLQVHHIRELSRSGTHSQRNLKPLCTRCHSKEHKHLHSKVTGRRKITKLSKRRR